MSKTSKKVSISDFERVANEQRHSDTTIDWNGVEVTVKYNLSLKEMMQFTQNIVNLCVTDGGVFIPEYFDFAVSLNILSMYANFKIPENAEKLYDLIMATDAVETVSGLVNRAQLESLVNSATKRIEYECSSTADIRKHLKQLDKLAGTVKDSFKKAAMKALDEIDPDDLAELSDLLADTPAGEYIKTYLSANESTDGNEGDNTLVPGQKDD